MTSAQPLTVTVADVIAARHRIADGLYLSPCPPSQPLSNITSCKIHCKLDYLQRTGSFKERGARNVLMQLSAKQKKQGIIAASAGNHAQGLAHHGQLLDLPVTVVMPIFAPLTKVNNCRQMHAEVILHGQTFDEARQHALALSEQRGLTFIHAYDNPHVIAGQGTMALEILEQVPHLEAIVVPVGGGGLIAGMGLVIKQLKPQVKVIGVEPAHAANFTAALKAGKPVSVQVLPTLADGLAVSTMGQMTFELARQFVDQVITVQEHELALAVLRLLELEKGIVEGAGASPLAACLSGKLPELADMVTVLPLCGGNIDTTILGRIIERGLAADGRLCRFNVRLLDRPGSLAQLGQIIGQVGVSIKDIHHDRIFAGDDLQHVMVHCVAETRDRQHIHELRETLNRAGFDNSFTDLK